MLGWLFAAKNFLLGANSCPWDASPTLGHHCVSYLVPIHVHGMYSPPFAHPACPTSQASMFMGFLPPFGNAMHAVHTQCEVLDVGFTIFWFRTKVFFRFLSI